MVLSSAITLVAALWVSLLEFQELRWELGTNASPPVMHKYPLLLFQKIVEFLSK